MGTNQELSKPPNPRSTQSPTAREPPWWAARVVPMHSECTHTTFPGLATGRPSTGRVSMLEDKQAKHPVSPTPAPGALGWPRGAGPCQHTPPAIPRPSWRPPPPSCSARPVGQEQRWCRSRCLGPCNSVGRPRCHAWRREGISPSRHPLSPPGVSRWPRRGTRPWQGGQGWTRGEESGWPQAPARGRLALSLWRADFGVFEASVLQMWGPQWRPHRLPRH